MTKGDSYDVREKDDGNDVRNLGKPVELAGKYFKQGADEVAFLNITGYRDLPLTDAPMLEVLRRVRDGLRSPHRGRRHSRFHRLQRRVLHRAGGGGGVLQGWRG